MPNVTPNSQRRHLCQWKKGDPKYILQWLHIDELKEANLFFKACYYLTTLLQCTKHSEPRAWVAFALYTPVQNETSQALM